MVCEKCGKQVQDESIFCKYCGSNNLNNIQPSDKKVESNKTINDTSVTSISPKNKNRNTSIRIINLCFIIMVLLAIILFVPFKQYYNGVVNNEIYENIEYRHLFSWPEEEKDVWIKPPGGIIRGIYDIKYNIHYLKYSIRFIILALLYLLIQASKSKLLPSTKSMSLKNIILYLYIILFISITIIFTPYVKLTYSTGKLLFTGERGVYPLFRFNDLMEVSKNGNSPISVYNIDFRFLLLEVVVLTVIFLIIYLNIRNKTKD